MTDVLIVGAGPTGLVLGIELLKRGVDVRLIDKAEGPSIHSKALGIQPRTLEIFETMGVLPPFLERGRKGDGVHIHWNKKQIQIPFTELNSDYPFILILPQSETEKILLSHFESLGGRVEWNSSFLDKRNGRAVIRNSQLLEEVPSPKYIVGCDGAHSNVRHALGVPFKGAKFAESFLVADVKANTPLQIEMINAYFTAKGLALVIPFAKRHHYRLVFPLTAEWQKAEILNEDYLQKLLIDKGMKGMFEIEAVDWISEFQIHRRKVNFSHKCNYFLAGDAAHVHSPVGGQGMNTSIQDAFNLGWKLALMVKGTATPKLVASYQKERLPVAAKVIKGTTLATQVLLFFQRFGISKLVGWLARHLNRGWVRRRITEKMSGIGLNYRFSPLSHRSLWGQFWPGPQPGDRMPNLRFSEGRTLNDFLKSGKPVVLIFDGNSELCAEMRQRFGDQLDILLLQDEKKACKQLSAGPKSLYCVRPDGYVAFRQRRVSKRRFYNYISSLLDS